MRGWRSEDHEAWAEIVADDETMRAIGRPGGLTKPEAWEDLARLAGYWVLKGFGHWAVEEREGGALVGRVGLLHPPDWPGLEVGWVIRADRRGRGYAAEAGGAAMGYAFEQLGADRVISLIADENAASRRVAEKLGERPEEMVEVRGFQLRVFRIGRAAWEAGKA